MEFKYKGILAVNEGSYIGLNGELLYHLKSDMKRFKMLTTDGFVIMGRKTFEEMGKPLPNRHNIVIGSKPGQVITDGSTTLSFVPNEFGVEQAIRDICEYNRLDIDSITKWVIGGVSVVEAFIPFMSEFHLTLVKDSLMGDTQFLWESKFSGHWSSVSYLTNCEDYDRKSKQTLQTDYFILVPNK